MKKKYDEELENTTSYRVRLLRQDRGWSQKELADKIFVAHSQISRLESGETTNIGSSLLVSLAKIFQVSTDYLLCLTPISVPKSYDISELGLSEEVIRRLLCKTIDPEVLNRLLEHDQFPKLCAMIKNYFYFLVDSRNSGKFKHIQFIVIHYRDFTVVCTCIGLVTYRKKIGNN